MPINDDEMSNSAQDQYNAAFEEGPPESAEPSEDDAFGITPPEEALEMAAEGAPMAMTDAPAVPEVGAQGTASSASSAEEASESGQNEAGEAADDQPTDPKELQRMKSWEGRLKKLEAELKAQAPHVEPAAAKALEEVGEQAEDSGNEPLGEAAEQVAEQVESGALSVAQAMRQLTEDFGEDFVKMIEAIASAKAGEVGGQAASSMRGDVDAIVSHIQNGAEKAHFKAIASAYPDFNELRQDPAFATFTASQPEMARIAQGGSADEVIGLIKQFKAQASPAAASAPAAPAAEMAADPEGADAAAGVRSGGLRLPAQPADSSDYEGAFDEASKLK